MPIHHTISITARVGDLSPNKPDDVVSVQRQLNDHMQPPRQKLNVDGKCGPKTIAMIRDFQKNVCGFRVPDGRVDPGGKTLMALNNPGSSAIWARVTAVPDAGHYLGPQGNPNPPGSSVPKQRGHLYIHAHDAPGRGQPGSIHAASSCTHIIIPGNGLAGTGAMIGNEITSRNLEIGDLVLNSHGSGAGLVSFGGVKFNLGDNLKFFDTIKPHFGPIGKIWIYACSFATPTAPTNEDDAWLVEPSEINHGAGTRAMTAIARHTMRPVRASFGIQFGDMSGFTTPWAEVTPSGSVTFHTEGRVLSTGEWITQKRKETLAFTKMLVTGQFL